jgi:hypothetical protein
MLNELYALSETLEAFDIQPVSWHDSYKKLPNASVKAPCYRLWISEAGSITGIEPLENDLVNVLRKFGNNQGTFPAFNIKSLYRITYEGSKREDNWLKSMKRIDRILESVSEEFLKAIMDANGNAEPIMVKLIEAVHTLIHFGFRDTLEDYLMINANKGNSDFLNILEFTGADSKQPNTDMGENISVIFDLVTWRDYGFPVASEEMTIRINNALNHHYVENDLYTNLNVLDAFGDMFDPSVDSEPMPEVKVSGFTVKLRSMFNGQPCQKRYGYFGDASYLIAKTKRNVTKGALEWIAKAENERVTWVRADKDELAFAYPSKLPEIPGQHGCAALFGGIGAETHFEKAAENFIRVFKGLTPEKKPEYIQVFSIRKMDRARSKIVFTRNMTLDGFITAAEAWQAGCQNIPQLDHIHKEKVPFPLDMARIINTVWKQNGEQVKRRDGTFIVKRIQVYQGLTLLLDTDISFVTYCLNVLVMNAFNLAVYKGNEYVLKQSDLNTLAEAASIFGLLLYKCGYYKEDYMNDTAFLTGQLLKVSDELHALYCKAVRKNGELPPQLSGASMLTLASDMPDKAMSQLCLRMKPYITWAKTYCYKKVTDEGKRSSTAGWLISQYDIIATQLHEVFTKPIRFNDFDKAQLFLGYLAAYPKRGDIGTALTDNNNELKNANDFNNSEGDNSNEE